MRTALLITNWRSNFLKNDMKKILLISSAVLMLASCGLYNKYERPEVVADGIIRDPVAMDGALHVVWQCALA